ncbi:2-oxoglutarate dehydrogenase E1 component [Holosporaceae bacterium 'Namur']|nr:2-oxoglutarate dehydrogenase E1 component [Holosporaceae bacterium 'Namur']
MSELKLTTPLYGANAPFIEELYNQYIEDPLSVDGSWQEYFKNLSDSPELIKKAFTAAPWQPRKNTIIGYQDKKEQPAKKETATSSIQDIQKSIAAIKLVEAYRTLGHLYVNCDPLSIKEPEYNAELDYKTYGLTEDDLDKEIYIGNILGAEKATLRDILSFLSSKYCSRLGIEYMYIENLEEKNWIQNKIESTGNDYSLSNEEKKKALFDLTEAEVFENYLHTKFPGAKRFSIEGGEGAIASMEFAIKYSVNFGVREVIIGMAHRGRLNTLTKVMGKPYHAMLSEFKGELAFPADMDIPGDVKYHLGTSSDVEIEGQKVHLSLTPNPSHLEVVNSIVLGKVRAKQDRRNDIERKEVLGLLIHGDAAFAGQGSVPETLYLSQLKGYHTGGTIHIIINNQIGFTTNPSDARSSRYCSDVAKSIACPIFHVNGDDAEGIIFATKIAAEYRAKFKKDIVIDIVCYRKYGHNEGDEPFFTQPIMYKNIANHKTPDAIYAEKLGAQGLVSSEEYQTYKKNFKSFLDEEYEKSQSYHPTMADWLQGNWGGFKPADKNREPEVTGVEISTLQKLGTALCSYPTNFNINPKIERQLQAKKQSIETGKGVDWATAEALAFASLINDGYNVRMTGQDVKRGTFSHRHAVLFDQENESQYTPLNNLSFDQKTSLEIHNSNLSEFAVMGFEYGYSFTEPNTLTIWEGQFGDFANGAQVIIDQYISSSEAKWLRMNGLVLLLPHGYEGQGPEHSSARIERFLQLCAKDNMQVVNCSTPASYFHVLRRQLCRNFRKPLVVMSPKSLLRHKHAVSGLTEMDKETRFKPVIDEVNQIASPSDIRKVIICSGKVYYDLSEKREELEVNDIAIIRLEQYYPFPSKELADVLKKYNNAQIFWCQEEHENMGAFYFVEPRIEQVLKDIGHSCKRARYIGRARSASPAVGYLKLHLIELKKLLEEVFG